MPDTTKSHLCDVTFELFYSFHNNKLQGRRNLELEKDKTTGQLHKDFPDFYFFWFCIPDTCSRLLPHCHSCIDYLGVILLFIIHPF